MKCYFTVDPVTGKKVLIPMCYGSLHKEDLSNCYCSDTPLTYHQFEKQMFNEKVKELIEEIKTQKETIEALLKIITN